MSVQVTDARADHARLQHDAREHMLLHLARNGAYDDPHNELLSLDRAEGVRVYDTAGREYIDALSCLFCAQIGYSYGDEMADAAAEQLRRMPFNTNRNTAQRAAVDLADKLAELASPGLDHVFFTGGGSESVETAWKLARGQRRSASGHKLT